MPGDDIENTLGFLRHAGQLKSLVRKGWTRFAIPDPESVAAHSYRMILMAMILGERANLDVLKLIKMCALHDIPEAIVGDITPHDRVPRSEKHDRESAAMRTIVRDLPEEKQFLELWMEYEAGTSEEARMAHQIDRIEMALQASEYQAENSDIDLSEFMNSVRESITDPDLEILFSRLT